jgi:hypothetical protein
VRRTLPLAVAAALLLSCGPEEPVPECVEPEVLDPYHNVCNVWDPEACCDCLLDHGCITICDAAVCPVLAENLRRIVQQCGSCYRECWYSFAKHRSVL